MNKKNIALFLILASLFSTVAFSNVNADDDGDDDEEYYIERTQEVEQEENEKSDGDNDEDIEIITQTVVVSPARTITENQLLVTVFSDRDRDGIIDDEDAHPDVAEIYLVKDGNLNGIVDTFEYVN